jgi:hypothetical protein
MQPPRHLIREVFATTGDPVVTIRTVRERFGLTLGQAKEAWLEATGRAVSLTAHQEELAGAPLRIVCPKCASPEAIGRKVHALPVGLGYSGSKAIEPPGELFVNGFWCNACEVGFIPDQLLEEFGLEKVRGV